MTSSSFITILLPSTNLPMKSSIALSNLTCTLNPRNVFSTNPLLSTSVSSYPMARSKWTLPKYRQSPIGLFHITSKKPNASLVSAISIVASSRTTPKSLTPSSPSLAKISPFLGPTNAPLLSTSLNQFLNAPLSSCFPTPHVLIILSQTPLTTPLAPSSNNLTSLITGTLSPFTPKACNPPNSIMTFMTKNSSPLSALSNISATTSKVTRTLSRSQPPTTILHNFIQ